MKVTIDIDCTPEEARRFFGLPDVAPMQNAMMADVQKRMQEALAAMGPEEMFKTWLPLGLQGWEQMQKAWADMGAAMTKGGGQNPGSKNPGSKNPGSKGPSGKSGG